ncbi:D-hexose-6-phosphate mutarotase [Streptomyces sp. NPDC059564]|uniref:D-hexose-6-phosphate mutarotase n=1 Tax=Streptomyces sp. NPDC059564 TaxID=3346865 RepID=UPI003699728B
MNDGLFVLSVVERLSPSVTVRRLGDLPVLVIDHARVRGAVTVQGGQVIAWQPAGSAPDGLWLAERNTWRAGEPVWGGVPLCWPWFGRAGQPLHGFARILDWDLVTLDESEDGVVLTLSLSSCGETLRQWPHDFTLFTRIVLGATCEIEVAAHGEHTSTAALHTFLSIGDLGRARLSGLGKRYADNLLSTNVDDADGTVTPAGHIERIYTDPEEGCVVKDTARGRAVGITHHGAGDVVVWNPGPDLSASTAQLTEADYRHFLCVETGRINTPLTSTPGHPGRLGLTLRLLSNA